MKVISQASQHAYETSMGYFTLPPVYSQVSTRLRSDTDNKIISAATKIMTPKQFPASEFTRVMYTCCEYATGLSQHLHIPEYNNLMCTSCTYLFNKWTDYLNLSPNIANSYYNKITFKRTWSLSNAVCFKYVKYLTTNTAKVGHATPSRPPLT